MAEQSTATDAPMPVVAVTSSVPVAEQKRIGRPKKGSRPKIDIDHEIEEANRLAEVTKKMMQAAKSAQRNSKRCKQRLVRKAGKLSASDLERIATLKRCGLFVPEVSESSDAATSSSGASSASTALAVSPRGGRMNDKLLSAVGQVQGAADLLSAMQQHVPPAGSAPAGAEVPTSTSRPLTSGGAPRLPRARRLPSFPPAAPSGSGHDTTATSEPHESATEGDAHESHGDVDEEDM